MTAGAPSDPCARIGVRCAFVVQPSMHPVKRDMAGENSAVVRQMRDAI